MRSSAFQRSQHRGMQELLAEGGPIFTRVGAGDAACGFGFGWAAGLVSVTVWLRFLLRVALVAVTAAETEFPLRSKWFPLHLAPIPPSICGVAHNGPLVLQAGSTQPLCRSPPSAPPSSFMTRCLKNGTFNGPPNGDFPTVPFWGPQNKDYSILGSPI